MTHNVLIRVETHDPSYWAYRLVSRRVGKIMGPKGEPIEVSGPQQTFLLFEGDDLESDGPYLRIHLTAPKEVAGISVRLPHDLVVLAVSDEQNRPIGFGANVEV